MKNWREIEQREERDTPENVISESQKRKYQALFSKKGNNCYFA
jgi:hypothetical protein